jgi:putative inorganic carbon (hco3(-)) transporter
MSAAVLQVVAARREAPSATAAAELSPSAAEEGPGPSPLGFLLFILVNAVLFIRPAEIIPELKDWPIYEVLIVACLMVSLPAILRRLQPRALAAQPITICVLGMLVAVVLSQVSHFQFGVAYDVGYEFAKIIVYYLLLVSLLTTFARLRTFLFWLVVFIVVLAALALLQYHGKINIPSLAALEEGAVNEETGEGEIFLRLRSTGIYHDPNDLCLILLVGMAASLYWLWDRKLGPVRLAWLAPLGVFGYALALTQSRGGFLALLGGLLVLFTARFGWRKSIPLAAVALPLMVILFGGRQTSINLSDTDDTGQGRIQLWKEGLELFKQAPVFGIGKGEYAEQVGHVGHNSFIHCYTELGVFGGTLFAGIFLLAGWCFHRVGSAPREVLDPEARRLRPYLLAAVVAYILGMLSLSRAYIEPTYMIPGLASAYLSMPAVSEHVPLPRFGTRLVALIACGSALTLASLYLFVRLFAA